MYPLRRVTLRHERLSDAKNDHPAYAAYFVFHVWTSRSACTAMLSAAGRTQLLYGIVQDGLLVGKFDGVVDFGCTVCHGDSFRALRGRHYRLDTKNLTSSPHFRVGVWGCFWFLQLNMEKSLALLRSGRALIFPCA